MNENHFLCKMEIGGFFFSICLGIVSCYLYQVSGHNLIVGIFAPIKKSGWEILKLLYFPYGIYTLIEYASLNRWYDHIPTGKFLGLLAGMVLFFSLWLGCDYLFSPHYLPLDIMLYLLSTAVAYLVSFLFISRTRSSANWICTLLFLMVGVCFLFFTLFPDLACLSVCKDAIETLRLLGNVGKCCP